MTSLHDRLASAQEHRLTSSRDYEKEAERARRRLVDNLEELGDRLTPGQVIDEMLTYSRASGGTAFRAFSNAMRENPIPSLLIGAGCMMFLSEKMGFSAYGGRPASSGPNWVARMGQSSAGASQPATSRVGSAAASARAGMGQAVGAASAQASNVAEAVRQSAAAIGDKVSGAAGAAGTQASSIVDTVSAQASNFAETMRQGAAGIGDTVSEAADATRIMAHDWRGQASDAVTKARQTTESAMDAVRDYSSSLGGRVSDVADRTRRQAADSASQAREAARSFVSEQPLLCAAIGVAIGAAIASMLPSTDVEDKLMGESSDAVKGSAQRTGSNALESAKNVASKVADRAQAAAKEEGLSASALAEAARNSGGGTVNDAQGTMEQPATGTGPQEGTAGSSGS